MVRYAIAFSLFITCPRMTQGAVLYLIDLYNNCGCPVELVGVRTHSAWVTIKPATSKSFMYWEGITLRISGRQLHFNRVDPPKEYTTGMSSVTFRAQLNPDLKIYVLLPGARRS